MKIVVFGTGFVGSALVREITSRGHEVTAVARHSPTTAGNVLDPAFVAEVSSGADVIVSALPASDENVTALLGAAVASGARLGVVGGSSVLPMVEGGPRLADTPGFPAWLLPRTEAHARVLEILGSAPTGVDWFSLVPAADFGPHQPGTRTGAYRTSTTALVTDDQGRSVLGVEDYAIAFADEIDKPATHRTWLAVGY